MRPLTLTIPVRGEVDVRTFTVCALEGFPGAVVYLSTLIGDPRVEHFVAYAERLGLPRTSTYISENGEPGYSIAPAGRGWRVEITPARRLRVRARGHLVADVDRTSAPDLWVDTLLAQRSALVIAGGPVPFMAGRGDGRDIAELITWACTHPTASGHMPAVEMPA